MAARAVIGARGYGIAAALMAIPASYASTCAVYAVALGKRRI